MPDGPSPRVAPDFRALLGSHWTHALHSGRAAAYGIWRDGRLGYLNRGWFEFARDNDGDAVLRDWPLGANIWQAIPAPLREFYGAGFERAVTGNAPWSHTYECSSPDLLRKFHMMAYPLDDRGLLIVNSLLHEVPHPSPPEGPLHIEEYLDPDGNLKQCMHCRRVLRVDGFTWDWIPELVAKPRPNMTGGLCNPCLAHHYPKAPTPRQ